MIPIKYQSVKFDSFSAEVDATQFFLTTVVLLSAYKSIAYSGVALPDFNSVGVNHWCARSISRGFSIRVVFTYYIFFNWLGV